MTAYRVTVEVSRITYIDVEVEAETDEAASNEAWSLVDDNLTGDGVRDFEGLIGESEGETTVDVLDVEET